ncbi:MAG: T9SS type A sorting domain-containing protein [Saprospiraceae bacterium]
MAKFSSVIKIFLFTFFLIFFYTVSQGQVNWTMEGSVDGSNHGNNHPRITMDAAGNPVLIWFNAGSVRFSRWHNGEFESSKILNPSITAAGASWMGPDIAAHGDTIYVVFKEVPEDVGHIWCLHSFDAGETFSDPVRVDFTADSLSRFPTVTTDASGHPVIAFMKFDQGFSNARWVVTRSNDFGNSFLPDVLASGWSSPTSHVCDCCPGAISSFGNNVVVLYRDNNNNIRDTWAALSTDGGMSFAEGINIDLKNWEIHACPSSGPDGVIIGDTLYSTFMNGASGTSRVYTNQTSLSDFKSLPGTLVTGSLPGSSQQNFPRISSSDNTVAVVWKQYLNDNDQCLLSFTSDITSGILPVFDTVATSGVFNSDIAIHNGNIIVVWEDYNSGTVEFRWGTYEVTTGTEEVRNESLHVFPNPSPDAWTLNGHDIIQGSKIEVCDISGQIVYRKVLQDNFNVSLFEIDNTGWSSGIYFLKITHGNTINGLKLVKF